MLLPTYDCRPVSDAVPQVLEDAAAGVELGAGSCCDIGSRWCCDIGARRLAGTCVPGECGFGGVRPKVPQDQAEVVGGVHHGRVAEIDDAGHLEGDGVDKHVLDAEIVVGEDDLVRRLGRFLMQEGLYPRPEWCRHLAGDRRITLLGVRQPMRHRIIVDIDELLDQLERNRVQGGEESAEATGDGQQQRLSLVQPQVEQRDTGELAIGQHPPGREDRNRNGQRSKPADDGQQSCLQVHAGRPQRRVVRLAHPHHELVIHQVRDIVQTGTQQRDVVDPIPGQLDGQHVSDLRLLILHAAPR